MTGLRSVSLGVSCLLVLIAASCWAQVENALQTDPHARIQKKPASFIIPQKRPTIFLPPGGMLLMTMDPNMTMTDPQQPGVPAPGGVTVLTEEPTDTQNVTPTPSTEKPDAQPSDQGASTSSAPITDEGEQPTSSLPEVPSSLAPVSEEPNGSTDVPDDSNQTASEEASTDNEGVQPGTEEPLSTGEPVVNVEQTEIPQLDDVSNGQTNAVEPSSTQSPEDAAVSSESQEASGSSSPQTEEVSEGSGSAAVSEEIIQEVTSAPEVTDIDDITTLNIDDSNQGASSQGPEEGELPTSSAPIVTSEPSSTDQPVQDSSTDVVLDVSPIDDSPSQALQELNIGEDIVSPTTDGSSSLFLEPSTEVIPIVPVTESSQSPEELITDVVVVDENGTTNGDDLLLQISLIYVVTETTPKASTIAEVSATNEPEVATSANEGSGSTTPSESELSAVPDEVDENLHVEPDDAIEVAVDDQLTNGNERSNLAKSRRNLLSIDADSKAEDDSKKDNEADGVEKARQYERRRPYPIHYEEWRPQGPQRHQQNLRPVYDSHGSSIIARTYEYCYTWYCKLKTQLSLIGLL